MTTEDKWYSIMAIDQPRSINVCNAVTIKKTSRVSINGMATFLNTLLELSMSEIIEALEALGLNCTLFYEVYKNLPKDRHIHLGFIIIRKHEDDGNILYDYYLASCFEEKDKDFELRVFRAVSVLAFTAMLGSFIIPVSISVLGGITAAAIVLNHGSPDKKFLTDVLVSELCQKGFAKIENGRLAVRFD